MWIGIAGFLLLALFGVLQSKFAANYRRSLRLIPLGIAQTVSAIACLVGLAPRLPLAGGIVFVVVIGAFAVLGISNVLRGIANARLSPLMRAPLPVAAGGTSLNSPPPRPVRSPSTEPPPPFIPSMVSAEDIGRRAFAPDDNVDSISEALDVVDAMATAVSALKREPPRPVLLLWVFEMDPNRMLINMACQLGPVYHLCGGGALASRGLLRAAFGNKRDQIEETTDEVLARLGEFTEKRRFLHYPVNSMLCGDGTWTFALDHLLERSRAVVMDLTEFSGKHAGCEYELGLLIDRVDLARVVLVTGPDTEHDALDRTLRLAWSTMASNSPNRAQGAGPLVVARVNNFEHPIINARSDEEKLRKGLQDAERQGLSALVKSAADRATNSS